MTTVLQGAVVALLLAAALAYLGRRGWRLLAAARQPKADAGCGGGCGCGDGH